MRAFLLPRRFAKKFVLLPFAIIICIFIYSILNSSSIDDDEEWYKHPQAYYSELSCNWDDYTMNLFEDLANRMSQSLEKLGIDYFLCYGSLWGALKFQRTLPWDRNVDMCVVYHQIASIDENLIHSTFKSNGLDYYYNSRRGKYVIRYKTVSGEITIFEKIGAHMERVGWEKRVFPHLYLNFQNFPHQLIERQMSRIKFHNLKLPIPHENYELQKYLYPDNWWREVKPKDCTE